MKNKGENLSGENGYGKTYGILPAHNYFRHAEQVAGYGREFRPELIALHPSVP